MQLMTVSMGHKAKLHGIIMASLMNMGWDVLGIVAARVPDYSLMQWEVYNSGLIECGVKVDISEIYEEKLQESQRNILVDD